jgi:hypothetical protein
MTAPAKLKPGDSPEVDEGPFAHLRATAEERARILSALTPFDCERWRREVTPATPADLAALEAFLQMREEDRRQSIEQEQERLEALGG